MAFAMRRLAGGQVFMTERPFQQVVTGKDDGQYNAVRINHMKAVVGRATTEETDVFGLLTP